MVVDQSVAVGVQRALGLHQKQNIGRLLHVHRVVVKSRAGPSIQGIALFKRQNIVELRDVLIALDRGISTERQKRAIFSKHVQFLLRVRKKLLKISAPYPFAGYLAHEHAIVLSRVASDGSGIMKVTAVCQFGGAVGGNLQKNVAYFLCIGHVSSIAQRIKVPRFLLIIIAGIAQMPEADKLVLCSENSDFSVYCIHDGAFQVSQFL